MTAPLRFLQPLGSLELEVMHLFWAAGPLTPRAAHTAMNERRKLVFPALQRVLERLHDRGLLIREARYDAPYAPAYDRSALRAHLAVQMLQNLGATHADRAAASTELQHAIH
jgi:predicted transcriptional regulator